MRNDTSNNLPDDFATALPTGFRDQLLQMEQVNPTYEAKYQKEVQAMLETNLTGGRKVSFIATGVFNLVLGVIFLGIAILAQEMPTIARLGLFGGAIFAFVWVALVVRIVKKGTFNIRTDSAAMAGWAWCLVVMMVTAQMMVAPNLPGNKGVIMLLSGLVFLVGGLAFLVTNKIEQAEINTRLKLLEVELRLAEVMEEVKRK